jgi:hypothetical protein
VRSRNLLSSCKHPSEDIYTQDNVLIFKTINGFDEKRLSNPYTLTDDYSSKRNSSCRLKNYLNMKRQNNNDYYAPQYGNILEMRRKSLSKTRISKSNRLLINSNDKMTISCREDSVDEVAENRKSAI